MSFDAIHTKTTSEEGYMMSNGLLERDRWAAKATPGVVHGGLLGRPRVLKEGDCITTGGIFGKPRFVKTSPATSPYSSPATTPELSTEVDVLIPPGMKL